MTTTTITLQVDADLAQAYQSAPANDQSKLRLLLNLWLMARAARLIQVFIYGKNI